MSNDGNGNFRLTRREREVLLLITDGLAYKEIATALDISFGTVNAYVNLFLRAFDFRSRKELAKWALQQPELVTRGFAEKKAA